MAPRALDMMSHSFNHAIGGLAWLGVVTGPIFDKELRVSSRRKRNYVLRCAYLGMLTTFIGMVWLSLFVASSRSGVVQVARMSEGGRTVIMVVAWFQFLAMQLLALLLLSDSISNEIRRQTLSVLMTTPITSFQIVMGKLFSRLLQLMLLLAISFPLLAMLRVYGGVPWGFVVAALGITLTAGVFVGSLSLFLSARQGQPYTVIVTGIILLGAAYAGVPLLLFLQNQSGEILLSVALLINPFMMMTDVTRTIVLGGSGGGISWPMHCLAMLAMSGVVLALAVVQVRRAALTMAFGKGRKKRRLFRRPRRSSDSRGGSAAPGRIRRVTGSAIVWKELQNPFLGLRISNKVAFVVLLIPYLLSCLPVLFLAQTASATPGSGGMVYYQIRALLMGIFGLITTVRTGAMAAGSIAKEKESRAWPILLASPLDDREIIRGKARAVFLRNAPLWLILVIDAVVGTIVMTIIFQGMLTGYGWTAVGSVAGTIANVILLIGAGLYFGVRCKSNSVAIIATLGVAFGVMIVGQMLVQVVSFAIIAISDGWDDFTSHQMMRMIFSLVLSIFCIAWGLLLQRAARRRVRRDVFGKL